MGIVMHSCSQLRLKRIISLQCTNVSTCACSMIQVRELDLATLRWRRVGATGSPPPFRIHSSAAVVGDKWIIHGGRRPGKFNVTNQTFVYNFTTNRCAATCALLENALSRLVDSTAP